MMLWLIHDWTQSQFGYLMGCEQSKPLWLKREVMNCN